MIPVHDLYAACEMMLREKWGYIWGASGELWTEAKQKAATREMTVKYGSRWIGHHVTDCSGVMVFIWRQHGMSIYHGSNTIRKKYCGPLQKTPAPGYAAFKVSGDDYHHIGIVAEDGLNVYESKGTQSGFVMSAASSWHCFAPFLDVDYDATEQQGGDAVIYSAYVTTSGGRLNIRKGPGTNYEIVGSLMNGEKVDIIEERSGWGKLGDSIEGWVSLAYLAPIEEGQQEEKPEPKQTEWGVYIPCDNEQEARRYAGDIKGALVLRKEMV